MDIWDARVQVVRNNLFTAAMQVKLKRKSKKRKRRVRKFLKIALVKEQCVTHFVNLVKSPEIYIDKFHMSNIKFLELFSILESQLSLSRSDCDDMPAIAKLGMVLEFLATDNMSFKISRKDFNQILNSVCDALEIALKDEIPVWNSNTLLRFAEEFDYKWNFPHCVGAIGIKHLVVKTSFGSNYDSDSSASIWLVAVADASYRFTNVDIQTVLGENDGLNVFANSDFGKNLLGDKFDFPNNRLISGKIIPYFLVGNESFPNSPRILMPYSTRKILENELIFNYRLDRAHACVENALGILTLKWRCLKGTTPCTPERAPNVVKACFLLHNYMMRVCKGEYAGDYDFRKHIKITETIKNSRRGRIPNYSKNIRDTLRNYFNLKKGAIPGQMEAAVKQNRK